MDDMRYTDSRSQQRDLVLSPNEFCYVQSKTSGGIKSYVGPMTMTISQTEALVIFDQKSKKFIETTDFDKAKQLFVSIPEGWYGTLKNPTTDNKFPEAGKPSAGPDTMKIGTKINIPGPTSFALYPGQMAKVIRGHRLRSNQYLIARVYDADAAKINSAEATVIDADGNKVSNETNDYFMGQLLVIKGTEVSFYVPPTGIEVVPVVGTNANYVRDAITLERLEYAILKDEDGEKRYTHGPAVVFPKPTEVFVETPKGGNIFRALELSPISGIYIKVIAAYDDEDGIHHPIGEELFITGNEQMIYYPRPEHAMIQYDGKYMHHAIAIPKGEGRYILNRLTGDITTVIGPRMYLPDPRTEIVVKRKLTRKECELIYPGNMEVLEFNEQLSEQAIERAARKGLTQDNFTNAINCAYSTADQAKSLAIFEANANISRGSSYTKPRTITLDTKFDGVVEVNVWTGYAVNVISKNGTREVVVGPKSRLLNYDETLEQLTLSTGRPKTDSKVLNTVYLNTNNNRVSDFIEVETADGALAGIAVCYNVNFLPEYKDKWFSVENYTKFLSNTMRSLIKRKVSEYNVKEFYTNSTDILRNIILDLDTETSAKETARKHFGRLFNENGMIISDVEILGIEYNKETQKWIERHQQNMIEKTIKLADAEEVLALTKAIDEQKRKKLEIEHLTDLYENELNQKAAIDAATKEEEIAAIEREAKLACTQAEIDLSNIKTVLENARLEREKANAEALIAKEKAMAAIEAEKQKNYADTVAQIMASITPDLVAALSTKANAELLESATRNMSPLAIAKGESVADTINSLLRGTTLESVVERMSKND